MIGPVAGRVGAADDHALLIPIHVRAHLGGAIAQGKAAAATVGVIGFRAVQQEIAVHGDFTGFQFRRFYGLLLSLALIKIGNHNAVIAVFLFQR